MCSSINRRCYSNNTLLLKYSYKFQCLNVMKSYFLFIQYLILLFLAFLCPFMYMILFYFCQLNSNSFFIHSSLVTFDCCCWKFTIFSNKTNYLFAIHTIPFVKMNSYKNIVCTDICTCIVTFVHTYVFECMLVLIYIYIYIYKEYLFECLGFCFCFVYLFAVFHLYLT